MLGRIVFFFFRFCRFIKAWRQEGVRPYLTKSRGAAAPATEKKHFARHKHSKELWKPDELEEREETSEGNLYKYVAGATHFSSRLTHTHTHTHTHKLMQKDRSAVAR